MEFYTYMYLRVNGTPYYVGKGHARRFKARHNFVPVPCASRILVQRWTSEQEALAMETWYIRFFGRQDIGTGILRNRSDGGEQPINLSPASMVLKLRAWAGQGRRNVASGHLAKLRTAEHQRFAGHAGGSKHSLLQQAHCKKIATKGGHAAAKSGQAGILAHQRWHVQGGKPCNCNIQKAV